MDDEINKIIRHLLRHKEFARSALSISYPFSIDELRKYSDKLEWEWISTNPNILWSEPMYNEFENKIILEALKDNDSFPWTEEFIDKHIMDFFYEMDEEFGVMKSDFGSNEGLPWSESFIDKYIEHWDWNQLSTNRGIPFTIDLIQKYSDKWNFNSLEFNCRIISDPPLRSYINIFHNCDAHELIHNCPFCYKGEEIFDEYKDRAVSTDFIRCPNFKWSDDFGSKLRSKLRGEGDEQRVVDAIRLNIVNHWSIDLLDAFEEFWDYNIINLPDELTDYLAFAIKANKCLDKIMKELKVLSQ